MCEIKKMEVSMSSIAVAIVVVSLVTWALNLLWLRPKKLEMCLRKQGFKGNPYKLFIGDLKESFLATKEANSRPISFSDDIVPRVLPFVNHIVEKYGNDSFTWSGRTPSVNIMDPEQIKDVFARIFDFPKPDAFKLLGNGLPNLPAEKWAVRKKIVNPAFHVEKLKLMLPAMYLSCIEMINKWEDLVSAKGSCELDAWPFLQNLMGEVISRTAFGSNYKEGRKIFQLQTENAELLLEAFHAPNIPGWRFLPTALNKRIKEINSTIHSELKMIVSKREEAMKAGEAANDDLLGILLESNMKEIRDHGNKKRAGLSLDDVIEECKIFYSAGQETTSTLLVWTMVLLSQHSNWQDRARAEVLEVFGDNKPDYEGLNRLKTMTMILNEVLRLYPPVPRLGRVLDKETKLGNLTLPAGVQIVLPLLLVHHDQKIWGEDAKEFNPERFANGISNATKNQVSSFFSFGWGPRTCIGQNFAMIEAKLTLAMILQHFWFELSPSYTHAPFSILSLQPQHGCQIVLHKR